MNKYICIHGHFYQPPRENPWLEDVESQDSAYPYHDWNERITAECYEPNAASRILDNQGKIADIINTYSKISFNFGPTLLSWMQKHKPSAYEKILEADKLSLDNFSGHGSAMAQCYNHIIMPLANSRDKFTQIIWGIKDFEYRFKRKPEGMWLAEAAVDLETLDIVAQQGVIFTVLSPYQAHKVRQLKEQAWSDVEGGKIDPTKPYLCKLKEGRSIIIFFYDGPISQDIAFGGLLDNGEKFAQRLVGVFSKDDNRQLVHIATDGETYGHHHNFGDMALSYCINHIEKNNLANITIYAQYLHLNPAMDEVEIYENSSWSCCHGVERWRDDCGCNSGMHYGWHQKWRKPLREALDWLRDKLAGIYEQKLGTLLNDPWKVRNDYIDLILERNDEKLKEFIKRHQKKELSNEEILLVIKLLEMQKYAMYMYTSCGWFFDEISGIEPIQIMQYAARALQYAQTMVEDNLEEQFLELLEKAPSNIKKYKNGAVVYNLFVKPAELDCLRVGAHYALSSVFEHYPETVDIACYTVKSSVYERKESGKNICAVGKAKVKCNITYDESLVAFAVLYLGEHNLIGGVREYIDEGAFALMVKEIQDEFDKGNVTGIIHLMDKYFENHNYSLWHLFRDEQKKIFNRILSSAVVEAETGFHRIYEHHYPVLQTMRELHLAVPKTLIASVEFTLHIGIRTLLEEECLDFDQLKYLVSEMEKWGFERDKSTLEFFASKKITNLMEKLADNPYDIKILTDIKDVLQIIEPLNLRMNLWRAENLLFHMGKELEEKSGQKEGQKDKDALLWRNLFDTVCGLLNVRAI